MAKHPYPIIIVDIQAAFAIPPKVLAGIERYSKNFQRRIFTRFVNPPRSVFRRVLKRDSCAPGSPDLRLLIEPKGNELVFDKTGYGLSHHQVAKLRREGISKVVVCGMDTDACVLGVMFSLHDAGIDSRIAPKPYTFSTQNLDTEARRIMAQQFPKLRSTHHCIVDMRTLDKPNDPLARFIRMHEA